MAKNSGREEEPSFAPVPDIWYDLRLGLSFRDHHPSSKFCSLRYECKPASVDKNHPGSLHKRKDNRVSVEFQNNRHGKPKVVFEGIADDYKNDGAVLFFDGQTFRLEQLHRAVEHLRYVHQPGESAAASVGPAPESHLPPVGKAAGQQFSNPSKAATQVEVERMDSGDLESLGGKREREGLRDEVQPHPASTALLEDSNYESSEENVDIMDDEDDSHQVAKEEDRSRLEVHRGIDINLPHREDEEDEIADVDVSDDELNAGCNAAEALRAQVAGEKEAESSSSTTSSSSSSSESSSSESESSSGSSGSESRSSSADSITSV